MTASRPSARSLPGEATRPIVCCDLDGVVWRGATPIAGSADAIAALRAAGLRTAFLTNNSSSTVATYTERLGQAGVTVTADEICSSAQAAAALLARSAPAGASVLACAGPGVVEALEARGFVVVDTGPVDAVVVGWHREFDFDRLATASNAVRAGARFVATNLDPTFPVPDGLLPGAGALVAAVATAAGRAPEVAGKPEAPMVDLVRERYGDVGVMVGDRPSTDGALADALGWPFALVLSGVAGPGREEPVPTPPPPFVADDLAALVPRVVARFAGA